MGNRPYARLFYGVKLPQDADIDWYDADVFLAEKAGAEVESWTAGSWVKENLGVVFGRSGYHDEPTPFLAIAESYISMDWDDGFVDVDPSHMAISKGQLTAWNKRIVDVLTMLGLVGEGFEVPTCWSCKGSGEQRLGGSCGYCKGTGIHEGYVDLDNPRWQLTTFY